MSIVDLDFVDLRDTQRTTNQWAMLTPVHVQARDEHWESASPQWSNARLCTWPTGKLTKGPYQNTMNCRSIHGKAIDHLIECVQSSQMS